MHKDFRPSFTEYKQQLGGHWRIKDYKENHYLKQRLANNEYCNNTVYTLQEPWLASASLVYTNKTCLLRCFCNAAAQVGRSVSHD